MAHCENCYVPVMAIEPKKKMAGSTYQNGIILGVKKCTPVSEIDESPSYGLRRVKKEASRTF